MQQITVRFRRKFDADKIADYLKIIRRQSDGKAKTADIEAENKEGKKTAFFVVRTYQDVYRFTGTAWRRLKFRLKLKTLKSRGFTPIAVVSDGRYSRHFLQFGIRTFTTTVDMAAADIMSIIRGRSV